MITPGDNVGCHVYAGPRPEAVAVDADFKGEMHLGNEPRSLLQRSGMHSHSAPLSLSSSIAIDMPIAAFGPRRRVQDLPAAAHLCILSFLDIVDVASAGMSFAEFQSVIQSPPVQRFLNTVNARSPADNDRSQAARVFIAARARLRSVLDPTPGDLSTRFGVEDEAGARRLRGAGARIILTGTGLAAVGVGLDISAPYEAPAVALTSLGFMTMLLGAFVTLGACHCLRVFDRAFENYAQSALRLHLAHEDAVTANENFEAEEGRFRDIGARVQPNEPDA